jgi:hypothetical protein
MDHQRGTIGLLTIRLIEGRDLDRGIEGSRVSQSASQLASQGI